MALEVNDSPLTRFAQDAERRRIARELHDSVVQSLTALVADLEYFRTRRLSAGGETNQEVAQKLETWQELAREYTSNLYAIIRESVTNICKHAHASKISVFMFSHEGQLHVSVADNGVGIPEPAAMYTKDGYHQGLIGLRERAAALEGLCSIESAPGRGTRVDVVIPLP